MSSVKLINTFLHMHQILVLLPVFRKLALVTYGMIVIEADLDTGIDFNFCMVSVSQLYSETKWV